MLKYDRTAKPAFSTFKGFTADTTPPVVRITAGPGQGSFTKNPTPTFKFAVNVTTDPGSTFQCRVGTNPFEACNSPFKTGHLADGPHSFSVQATDPPGNESAVLTRSFTVDTHAPAAPQITGTDPASPGNSTTPKVIGTAEGGSTVKIYKTTGCTGSPAAKGTASQFQSPGIAVPVPTSSTTTFRAKETDRAGNTSGCSAGLTYVETP